MKVLLIGFLAFSSIHAFSQEIVMKITNKNFPNRSITISCVSSTCDYLNIKTTTNEKMADKESLIRLSNKHLKRVNGLDEHPFSFVTTSFSNTQRDFEMGDYGNAIGNSVVTVLAVPADIFLLPMKSAMYLSGKREGIESKRTSKKLLKFIAKNQSVETQMKDYQFNKFEEGLNSL